MSKRKRRAKFRRHSPPGAPPGTIAVDPDAPRPAMQVIAWDNDRLVEEAITDPARIRDFVGRYPKLWVNVDGLGDAATLQTLGAIFNLHRLALEDVVNVHQRSKVEVFDPHHYIVARMLNTGERLETEQLSLFLGTNYVLTFQESPGDCFDPVRARLRNPAGVMRPRGPDYVCYALIDAVIDNYFPVLETLGDRLEELEDEILRAPSQTTVAKVMAVKRDLLTVRRAVWPLREAINALLRDHSPFIAADTRLYFRDCYDHAVQIIDLLETFREMAQGLLEVYLSAVSQRMNEVMKVLTVIATIFIPLTFITGLYGMNFDPQRSPFNMPELEWRYGYPFVLGVMSVVAGGLVYFFKRKRWIGGGA